MNEVLRPVALAAAIVLGSIGSAQAGTISGTFTGVVSSNTASFDGSTATGTFSASDNGCVATSGVCFGNVAITINTAGQTLGSSSGPNTAETGTITVTNGLGSQQLSLDLSGPSLYNVTLSGPANAFVNGLNYSTLSSGPVTGASASFAVPRVAGGTIRVTSLGLNGAPAGGGTAVPEPATWLLLGAGLAGLAFTRRHVARSRPGALL